MRTVKVRIRKKPGFEDLSLPGYMSTGAAGMDLSAAVEEALVLLPGEIKLIPCGFYLALPEGFEAQIRPRSGLALKQGFSIVNSPGTIDSDYRGEIGVIAINLGKEKIDIVRGMRVAQMVVQEVARVCFEQTDFLDETCRGSGGFGHTGVEEGQVLD